jgi:hypothetical protein
LSRYAAENTVGVIGAGVASATVGAVGADAAIGRRSATGSASGAGAGAVARDLGLAFALAGLGGVLGRSGDGVIANGGGTCCSTTGTANGWRGADGGSGMGTAAVRLTVVTLAGAMGVAGLASRPSRSVTTSRCSSSTAQTDNASSQGVAV